MIFSPVLLEVGFFCRASLLKPGMKAPQLHMGSGGVRDTQDAAESGPGLAGVYFLAAALLWSSFD